MLYEGMVWLFEVILRSDDDYLFWFVEGKIFLIFKLGEFISDN